MQVTEVLNIAFVPFQNNKQAVHWETSRLLLRTRGNLFPASALTTMYLNPFSHSHASRPFLKPTLTTMCWSPFSYSHVSRPVLKPALINVYLSSFSYSHVSWPVLKPALTTMYLSSFSYSDVSRPVLKPALIPALKPSYDTHPKVALEPALKLALILALMPALKPALELSRGHFLARSRALENGVSTLPGGSCEVCSTRQRTRGTVKNWYFSDSNKELIFVRSA